jgi:hypothetical protein
MSRRSVAKGKRFVWHIYLGCAIAGNQEETVVA